MIIKWTILKKKKKKDDAHRKNDAYNASKAIEI